ncbi:hypothetical protein [Blastopirellula marina]|uniref:hypothetical protein n=1 Tax=Blastopirellula marina TaxID=124 RepID=UPI0011B01613|nr:hypothetical protein [Blastopirellula marina]
MLESLLRELKPAWLEERLVQRNLFRAIVASPNRVVIGLQGMMRLQVCAYGFALIVSVRGESAAERQIAYDQVADMLEWAVGDVISYWAHTDAEKVVSEDPCCVLDREFSGGVFDCLTEFQRTMGGALYESAASWLFCHELARLKISQDREAGSEFLPIQPEADRMVLEWLLESSSQTEEGNCRTRDYIMKCGIMLAIIWLTVEDAFRGLREPLDNAKAYARLLGVLDEISQNDNGGEFPSILALGAVMLRIVMRQNQFQFDHSDTAILLCKPREHVARLIDRILRSERRTGP